MEQVNQQNQPVGETRLRYLFFYWIAPSLLVVATVFTTLLMGNSQLNYAVERGAISLWKGLPFSLAMLLIVGAHGLGHYFIARFHDIKARPPYFIPTLNLSGTAGAFTKMNWPISNRQALIHIFVAGPMAGFCFSLLMCVIGLSMSSVLERGEISENFSTLGNSLSTYIATRIIFAELPDIKDILLHPIGFAGWIGMYYNFWHLLPIGKLDGGRIIYALFGYRMTRLISFLFIALLIILSYFWPGWLGLAILGGISMIHLRRQYPVDNYDEPLKKSSLYLTLIVLTIFILSFMPKPIFREPAKSYLQVLCTIAIKHG